MIDKVKIQSNTISSYYSKIAFNNYKYLSKIYNKDLNKKVYIEVIDSKKDFDFILGYKTPNWLVAISKPAENKINIMNANYINKHSRYNFKKILMHEMVHIFNYEINKKISQWLDEGIALNIAKQNKSKKILKKNWLFFEENLFADISLKEFVDHEGYKIAYSLIKNEMKKNGNIISLIQMFKKEKQKKFFKSSSLCI